MNGLQLNLARKWRSRDFNHIIGQELAVKMLKNNLYVGHYFPVYLLSGQRGCGKTTTARVFATAVNCENLEKFRTNPKKYSAPCLKCPSCSTMLAGRHPDFFEIDAASHTGVDHVRQIIDAASFLPLMGRKKIYLIDEAHMLSKAAFNALLKILEEPPPSVLFILATTDVQKIIETVRSRCFQIFFKPVDQKTLINYLKTICMAENIEYEDAALIVIAQETGGSVRDALNLLEQVRFACNCVSKSGVCEVLGYLDDESTITLLEILIYKTPDTLLAFLKKIKIETYSADFLWVRLLTLLRVTLWIYYGLEPEQFKSHISVLQTLVKKCSAVRLIGMWEFLFNHEQLFIRTTSKHALLEMLFMRICRHNNDGPTDADVVLQQVPNHASFEQLHDVGDNENKKEVVKGASDSALWQSFVSSVEELHDPLLSSIFKQGTFVSFNKVTGVVEVAFSKEFVFFKEWLENTKSLWEPRLKKVFTALASFNPLFTLAEKTDDTSIQEEKSSVREEKKAGTRETNKKVVRADRSFMPKVRQYKCEERLDISDKELWKKSHLLLHYFPGTISKLTGNVHE